MSDCSYAYDSPSVTTGVLFVKDTVSGKTKALKGTDRVTITTVYNHQSWSNLPVPSLGTDCAIHQGYSHFITLTGENPVT